MGTNYNTIPNNSFLGKYLTCVIIIILFLVSAPALYADDTEEENSDYITDVPNSCRAGGQGLACETDEGCSDNSLANFCISHGEDIETGEIVKQCEISCEDNQGNIDEDLCSAGETCLQSDEGRFYCQRTRFTMDLNLLDNCIVHFLEGMEPDFVSGSTCSIESHLNRMLDQDNDDDFDIFDADKCVKAFLNPEICSADTQTCPSIYDVYCEVAEGDEDDPCGVGSFCNGDTNKCERECGFIFVRTDNNELMPLNRQCLGNLKQCNYKSGRCEDVVLDGITCQVDQDCPAGAYCFMGECAPKCNGNLDCPGSDWYCAPNSTCQPIPPPVTEEGFQFNPRDYNIQYSQTRAELTNINNEVTVPLLIMNLETKRQVIDNQGVIFGYRLLMKYSLKEDSKCLNTSSDISCDIKADCQIAPEEEFVTMLNPIGTVTAKGHPAISFVLDPVATSNLTPGKYQASALIYFNNGSQSQVDIVYNKHSMSGMYQGQLSMYIENPDNHLGNTYPVLHLNIHDNSGGGGRAPSESDLEDCIEASDDDNTSETTIAWTDLLARENINSEETVTDLNEGFYVTGYIDANSSMVYNQPKAYKSADNRIPVKGIYSSFANLNLRNISFG